jgi:hypothetical protein
MRICNFTESTVLKLAAILGVDGNKFSVRLKVLYIKPCTSYISINCSSSGEISIPTVRGTYAVSHCSEH